MGLFKRVQEHRAVQGLEKEPASGKYEQTPKTEAQVDVNENFAAQVAIQVAALKAQIRDLENAGSASDQEELAKLRQTLERVENG